MNDKQFLQWFHDQCKPHLVGIYNEYILEKLQKIINNYPENKISE